MHLQFEGSATNENGDDVCGLLVPNGGSQILVTFDSFIAKLNDHVADLDSGFFSRPLSNHAAHQVTVVGMICSRGHAEKRPSRSIVGTTG